MVYLRFLIPKSFKSSVTQVTSQVVNAMALYSSSTVDLAITCFFDFHDIGDDLKKMHKPIVEFQDAQTNCRVSSHRALRLITVTICCKSNSGVGCRENTLPRTR